MFQKFVYLFIFFGIVYGSKYYPQNYNETTKGRSINVPFSKVPGVSMERFGDYWYFISNIFRGTLDMAKQLCELASMELLSIESKEENEFLATVIPKYFLWEPIDFVWTSGKIDGCGFIWESTGEPVVYSNWKPGQPDSQYGLNKYIMLIYSNSSKTLEWELQPDTALGHSVCKLKVDVYRY